MRDIKFRAWNTITKDMEPNFQIGYSLNPAADDDYHIQQYTGLKDKNGVEIYEGDIVKVESYHDLPVVVTTFHDGSFGFMDKEAGWIPFAMYVNPEEILRVLGNIFENPELLEVSE